MNGLRTMILVGDNEVKRNEKAYQISKRAFDLISSTSLLIVIWPLFLVLMTGIKIDSKGPAIFKQKRIGMNGKPVYIYKFRTMVDNAEEYIELFTPEQKEEWEKYFKLKDDPRITKVGKFLRKTSLDELPQLFNIIRGDLSVVGPRPVVEDEIKEYGAQVDKFLSRKPGLTGYWQAYARSDCDYDKRKEMELYYIDNANFIWDIKIIFRTIYSVIAQKGAR